MKKYGLSPRELRTVYRQIRLERETRLAGIIVDLMKGVPHVAIMQKHRLSSGALERILRTASTMTIEHLPDSSNYDAELCDEVTIDFRTEPRHKPLGSISAWDHRGSIGECLLRDISKWGLCLLGAQASVNETCELAILGDDLGLVAPFELKAECVWKVKESKCGRPLAGFRITEISPGNLKKLLEFIENHTCCE